MIALHTHLAIIFFCVQLVLAQNESTFGVSIVARIVKHWWGTRIEDGKFCTKWDKCKEGLFCDFSVPESSHGFGVCRAQVYSIAALGESCESSSVKCTNGTTCVAEQSGKRCKKEIWPGGSCSDYSKYFCSPGLECSSAGNKRVCKISLGANCNTAQDNCKEGLVCSNFFKFGKRCVLPLSENTKCSVSFAICTGGLKCMRVGTDKRCVREKVDKGGLCGYPNTQCNTGLSCIGTGSNARCYELMKYGGRCDGTYTKCESGIGLKCIGPAGVRKCLRIGAAGSKCNQYTRCTNGWRCYHGYCVKFVGRGGHCSKKGILCYPGLRCLPHAGSRRCFRPVPTGFYCDHPRLPYLVCPAGNFCYGNGYHARCVAYVAENGSCEGKFKHCSKGLHCLGSIGKRRCKRKSKATKGEVCGKHTYCIEPYVCYADKPDSGICFTVQGENGQCGTPNTICGPNLICGGKTTKKCTRPVQLGGKCGTHIGQCQQGLECRKYNTYRICMRVVDDGFLCSHQFVACKEGSVCAGLQGNQQCVRPKGSNSHCDNIYWVCGAGLRCKAYGKETRCGRSS